ncbi:thiol:disulfide interchange protein DsbA/DsbL [Kitasatospora sp. CB02891]|uniref:thiol:disulfide interchange protein DsbA/DsbL n=1 Tax=Kitasatospora sp. CB02891 TaxID=2020329 RepID=UPI0012FDC61D|nr:thiol:disulfide interchange protein DsbA/DsbL [Kitasatospora sp. CB02891]
MKPLLRTTVLIAVAGGLIAAPAAAADAVSAVSARPSASHGLTGKQLLTPGQYLAAVQQPGPAEQHGSAPDARPVDAGSQAPAAAPQSPPAGTQAAGPQATRLHEAVEFFWYNCLHSAALEAPLTRWAARHQPDVTLRRIPAIWVGSPDEAEQRAHARLFYTLDRLGEVDRQQAAVFRAVRDDGVDLTTEQRAADWAAAHGMDAAEFRAAYHSAEVDRAVAQAPRLFADYQVNELPTVVVDHDGRTSPTRAGGVENMPAALDRLVAGGSPDRAR